MGTSKSYTSPSTPLFAQCHQCEERIWHALNLDYLPQRKIRPVNNAIPKCRYLSFATAHILLLSLAIAQAL